jgi:hypothetical protein
VGPEEGVTRGNFAEIYHEDEVRYALDIGPQVPVQFCDARQRSSGKQVLVRLLDYLMVAARTEPSAGGA